MCSGHSGRAVTPRGSKTWLFPQRQREHLPTKQGVGCSNHPGRTTFSTTYDFPFSYRLHLRAFCQHCPQSLKIQRLIGSIRRECLDHLIVFNESSLRRSLKLYLDYYHGVRSHLSLEKDARETRPVQPPEMGSVVELADVAGLHHRYERLVACRVVLRLKKCLFGPRVDRDPGRVRPGGNRTSTEFAPASNLGPAPTRQFLDPLTLL